MAEDITFGNGRSDWFVRDDYANALQTYPDFIASVLSNDLLGKSAKGVVLSSVLEATQGQAVKINFKQLNLE
jgi:hypothetical protein